MRYLKSTYAAVLLAIGTAVPHATTLAQEVKVAAEAPLRLLDPVGTTAYITRNHAYMVYDTLFALDAQLAAATDGKHLEREPRQAGLPLHLARRAEVP